MLVIISFKKREQLILPEGPTKEELVSYPIMRKSLINDFYVIRKRLQA